MPGIFELYVTHALDHINGHVAAGSSLKISRSTFELTLMRELDRFRFPIEYKLAWFHAILTSDHSTTFWLSTQFTHSLPLSCIARYTPDSSLLTLEDLSSTPHLQPDPFTPPPVNSQRTLSPFSTSNYSRNAFHPAPNGDITTPPATNTREESYHADISSPQTVKKEKGPAKAKAKAMAAGGKPRAKPGPKKGFKRTPKEGVEGGEKPKKKKAVGTSTKRGKGKGVNEEEFGNGLGKSVSRLEPFSG